MVCCLLLKQLPDVLVEQENHQTDTAIGLFVRLRPICLTIKQKYLYDLIHFSNQFLFSFYIPVMQGENVTEII